VSLGSGASSGHKMVQAVVAGIVTRTQPSPTHTVWRYREADKPSFDPDVFDEQKLADRGLLDGVAQAGRGNTRFFSLHGRELVLRHYRRGGMAQRISQDRYLFTGLERTRAMQEFSVLLELHKRGLPAPSPYACRIIRQGAWYRASLVTYRLPGHTLAECLANGSVDCAQWEALGETIARFHSEGLFHADLNAHNIMIDSLGRITLLDFDRAAFQLKKPANPVGGWRRRNMNRLHRSLKKIELQSLVSASKLPSSADKHREAASKTGVEEGYRILLEHWEASL